jgi:hypothetical protein
MSYDLGLYRDKNGAEALQVENHEEGGTHALGGTTDAELNITYNYAFFYYQFLDKKDGLRWLYGRQAKDCIERLEKAVEILGTRQYSDYWAATPGNAGHALNILLQWAKQHPEGYFSGD